MQINHSNVLYSTEAFDDPNAGSVGLNLLATAKDATILAAKITFWDATGQFYLETNRGEVPLEVIEKFIAEAKREIPTG